MKATRRATVQQSVKNLLQRSPAFIGLPADRRSQIARDTVSVATYLTELPEGTDGLGELVQEVDFPAFVGDLIKGVFQSIVTSSIDQMKAYAKLVASVAKSVDQFADENISDKQARDFLAERSPGLKIDPRKLKAKPRALKRLATTRQQLLATMVLMGINRIVVTDGKISARKKAQSY